MKRETRGRSYSEFDLSAMSLAQLEGHIRDCSTRELSCKGNKSRRYWRQHKDEAQSELDRRLATREVDLTEQ